MWSLILHPGQSYHLEITQPIQLTNISFGDEVIGNERSVLKVRLGIDAEEDDDAEAPSSSEATGSEIIIAALTPGQMEVATTNVLLSNEVDYVVFSVTGPNEVHLVGHYTDTNSASAGLHGVLMASDSENDSDAGSLADDEDYIEEIGNEVTALRKDREAATARYALEEDTPAIVPEGYEYKDKTYPAGVTAFVDDDISDSSENEYTGDDDEEDVSMSGSDSDLEVLGSDDEETESIVMEMVAEAREEYEELKREKDANRAAIAAVARSAAAPIAMEE